MHSVYRVIHIIIHVQYIKLFILGISWHVYSSFCTTVTTDEEINSPFSLIFLRLPSLHSPSLLPGPAHSKLPLPLFVVLFQLPQKPLHVRLLLFPAKFLTRPVQVAQPRALSIPEGKI